MTKRRGLIALVVVLLMVVTVQAFAAAPAAQEEAIASSNLFSNTTAWIAITAGFAMAIASSMCGTAQGKAVIAACEGIARNPSGGGLIRGSLIIGLVLIESLAIYTLLVALVLIFMLAP
jgi:F-type H+-transporting ATPase subunit c